MAHFTSLFLCLTLASADMAAHLATSAASCSIFSSRSIAACCTGGILHYRVRRGRNPQFTNTGFHQDGAKHDIKEDEWIHLIRHGVSSRGVVLPILVIGSPGLLIGQDLVCLKLVAASGSPGHLCQSNIFGPPCNMPS